MANIASSHLYHLIYSLSRSEKRYFKLYGARYINKDNDLCIKLFDLIVKNEGVKIDIIEEKITFTKHPSRLKNYLFEAILKSLDSYNSKTTPSILIRKQINQIENLFHKSIYQKCIFLAKKTLKEAEKFDNQNFKITILDWYIRALANSKVRNATEIMIDLNIKQQEAIDKLNIEIKMSKLSIILFSFIKKKGRARSTEDIREVNQIIQDPLLQNYEIATSFLSKTYFNTIYSCYWEYLGDYNKAIYYTQRNILVYNDYIEIKNIEQNNYIMCLNNHANANCKIGNYDEAELSFSEMEKITPKTDEIRIRLLEYLFTNKLHLYLVMPDFKKALAFAKEIEKVLEKKGKKMRLLFKVSIYSNLCSLFFLTGQYSKALQYNNLLTTKNNDFRSDVIRFAKIMQLLIHYEKGETRSIFYFYESTERFLNKEKNISLFEQWFLLFFKTLLKTSKKDERSFFEQERKKLLEIFKDKEERTAIEYFNFLAWLKTKTNSITIEKAIKEYSSKKYEDYIKL